MGVYLNLSKALKALYLADECAILYVCRLDTTGKLCINDNYDCSIGHFSADQSNNVIYHRQLTKESEVIEDPSLLINDEDYQEIVGESQKSEVQSTEFGQYYSSAVKMVDRAIVARFNQLSRLLTGPHTTLTSQMNNDYGLEFEFDLVNEANQFYQESNSQIHQLSLEGKIEMLKQIASYLQRCQSEIETLRQLEKDFTEDESQESQGPQQLSTDTFNPSYVETDDPSWDDLGFIIDATYDEIYEGSGSSNDVSKINFNALANDTNTNSQVPNPKPSKVLFDSPPSSPHLKKSQTEFKAKERDPNRAKKTVNFDLEQTQTVTYEKVNDPDEKVTDSDGD
jgi:hypothetical protein